MVDALVFLKGGAKVYRHKINKILAIALAMLIVISALSLPVYATQSGGNTPGGGNGDGTVGNNEQSHEHGGTGGDGNSNIGGFGLGGWFTEQQGFRLYMVDTKSGDVGAGNIVSNVLDFEFPGTPASSKDRTPDAARGYNWHPDMMYWKPAYPSPNRDFSTARGIYSTDALTILDGMPKFTTDEDNPRPNGNAITEWALELDDEGIHKINRVVAVLFSAEYQSRNSVPVLKAIKYNNSIDMYDAYLEGKVALVIEPVYWYVPAGYTNPNDYHNHTPVNFLGEPNQKTNGAKIYAYGSVHNLAEKSKEYAKRLYYTEADKNGNYIGTTYFEPVGNAGGWCRFISNLWPHALQLSDSDPNIPPYTLVEQPGGYLNMDEILDGHSGYNLRVYKEEDHPDKWATYLAHNEYYKGGKLVSRPVGGGKPPVNAPKQAPKVDIATRPVKIIKIYEDILIKNDGTEEIEKSWLKCDKSTSYSRVIDIQDEPLKNPEYKVEHWYTAVDEGPWGGFPWADTWKPWQPGYDSSGFKGESSTTITVPDYHGDQSFDVLIVHLVKREKEDPPTEEVKLILNESEISHAYNTYEITEMNPNNTGAIMEWTYGSMSGVCNAQVTTSETKEVANTCNSGCMVSYNPLAVKPGHHFPWEGAPCPDGGTHSETVITTVDCNKPYTLADRDYRYNYKGAVLTPKTIANIDPFKVKNNTSWVTTQPFGSIESIDGGTNKAEGLAQDFIVWRGDDIPTLAGYKPSSSSPIGQLLDGAPQIGKDKGSPANHTRKPGESVYKEEAKIKFIDDRMTYLTDYETSAACPIHKDHKHPVIHTVKVQPEVNAEAIIHYYSGAKKAPAKAKADASSALTKHFGDGGFGNHHTTVIYNEPETLKFTPYIKMTYMNVGQPRDGVRTEVDILSQWPSEMTMSSGMTVGWKSAAGDGNGYNVALRSDQWATDNKATSGDKGWNKSNQVLDGGNIFQLTTADCDGKSYGATVHITGYYPVITGSSSLPGSMPSSFAYPSDWANDNRGAADVAAVQGNIVNLLSKCYMQMYVSSGLAENRADVNNYSALGGIPVLPGQPVPNGQIASEDEKYYLRPDANPSAPNYAGLVATPSGVNTTKYEFSADTEGNIKMNGSVILTKGQGPSELTNRMAKEIDSYTKVVTNLCGALNRNKGKDETAKWAPDGAWYNEAVEGIYVYVSDASVKVGLPNNDHAGVGGVQAVLDPRLCPSSTGTSEKYTKAYIWQFNTAMQKGVSSVKIFGNRTAVGLPDLTGILKTRPAFTCISIQDSD